jgi:hypothetical protein
MRSARFFRDSINDKPPIDDGELVIVHAPRAELIPKQTDPAARKRRTAGSEDSSSGPSSMFSDASIICHSTPAPRGRFSRSVVDGVGACKRMEDVRS